VRLEALDGSTRSAAAEQLAPYEVTEAIARAHTARTMGDVVQGLSRLTSTMSQAVANVDDTVPGGEAPLPAVSAILDDLSKVLDGADLTRAADRREVTARVEALRRYGEVARLEGVLGEAQQSAADLVGELTRPGDEEGESDEEAP